MLNNKYTDLKLSVAEQLAAAHEATRQARDELFEARRAIQDK